MEEERQVDVTLVESESEEAILERASDGTEEVAGNMELELPDALQDLLRRLSGVLRSDEEAVTEIPNLRGANYGGFFEGESGTRSEVRLKFLEAVGKCKTLRKFENRYLTYGELSLKEWEAILIPMQKNLELEKIVWVPLQSSQIEEEIGLLLHDLVAHVPNLASLEIRGNGRPVIGKSVAAIASGLRVNGHHRLKELVLQCTTSKPYDDDAIFVAHAAEIISLAPELSMLRLRRIYRIDGIAKEALTAALKGCFNLKFLSMGSIEAEEIGDVLAEVYGRTCPRPFLERLMLSGVKGLTGDVLASLIGSNIRLIDVNLLSMPISYFNVAPWQSIGKGLLQPLTLSTLRMKLHLSGLSEGELQKIAKGLAELWTVSEKSPILEVSVNAGETMKAASHEQVVFLENAVKDTYIRNIFLNGPLISSAFESFVENLASNTSVRILYLYNLQLSERVGSKDGWAHLFRHLRDNTSLTILFLHKCRDLSNEDFRDFMDLLQVNFTIEKVILDQSGWIEDGKDALIKEVLQRNKRLAGYFSVLGKANLLFGGAKPAAFFCAGPHLQVQYFSVLPIVSL